MSSGRFDLWSLYNIIFDGVFLVISEEVVESVAVTAALVRVVPQLQAQLGLTDQLLEIVHVLHNSLDYKSLREAAKKLFF